MLRTALMRCAVLLVVACAAPRAHEPDPTAPKVIDAVTYADRIAGIEATLARSHVSLVTGSIETCDGHDLRGHCLRCEAATRENTAGVDPDLLDGVAIAFGRYPPQVLALANLKKVALCREIRYTPEDGTPPAGVAIHDGRILISVEYYVGKRYEWQTFTIEEVVHHEVFHLLDTQLAGSDREWQALNPRTFEYRDPAPATDERPAGFVNAYATTNDHEDRASTYEYLMSRATTLCEIAKTDPIVAAKTKLVWKRVELATGAAFLERYAPCVDWIKPRKSAKPRPQPKPKLDLRLRH